MATFLQCGDCGHYTLIKDDKRNGGQTAQVIPPTKKRMIKEFGAGKGVLIAKFPTSFCIECRSTNVQKIPNSEIGRTLKRLKRRI